MRKLEPRINDGMNNTLVSGENAMITPGIVSQTSNEHSLQSGEGNIDLDVPNTATPGGLY